MFFVCIFNRLFLQVDVVEVHVAMTPSMSTCQTCLLDLIDACVKELKKCNKTVSDYTCGKICRLD